VNVNEFFLFFFIIIHPSYECEDGTSLETEFIFKYTHENRDKCKVKKNKKFQAIKTHVNT